MRFRSSASNPSELRKIVDFSCAYLKKIPGVEVLRYESLGKPSLVASFEKSKRPEVALVGHLDIVEVEKKHDLLLPCLRGRRLIGRGAADMRGGVAVFFEVMKYFSRFAKRPSLALMLSTDEEIGGYDGMGYLTKTQKYRPRIALIPDSGLAINSIVRGEKGALHIKVSARGLESHGAEPWDGENAIELLFDARDRMCELLAIENYPAGRRWIETINIGTIHGGTSVNKVPSHAEMKCDIRFTEKYTARTLLKLLQKNIPFCRIEQIMDAEVTAYDPKHPLRKLYKRVLEKEIGKMAKFVWEHGNSDGRFFTKGGTTVIVHSPTGGKIHDYNEWIGLKSQEQYLNILKAYIHEVGYPH
ncbi:MAG TPA: M20/M25/M40 family metallo-hydrolase [Patescibacteria group bacterium]|nr:M20/M25/M40 family metallo-hydrolase [Patescibacteria group bacterium]